jgi:thymidylate synthase (FAD)
VLSQREAELHALARQVYDERLEAGVAREQARKDLPLSTYTELYWTNCTGRSTCTTCCTT